ncbi:uncharacterized protein EDB93DRAFT_1244675 [Suillus bovinus]|uniref:uncharacterized protein n=1 Tax=Suillus bovinus TaxID=48563 RepID=UPI001B86E776|nr:uncharacterized protein EDB93DRAFT_1244675 [Suillus bovinus]KAG2159906.1 hypothetical protein EDB93DRAFT_1244675 [Suillus bovinus]
MTNFDLSLLELPCSPSPEAEAPINAAPVAEEPAQKIPEPAPVVESAGNHILLGMLSGSHPELLQECLEDIESWLHEWAHFEANVCVCTHDALEAEVLLLIGDEEKEILQDLNKWVGVARKMVSGWKEVAEKIMAEARAAHTAKEKGKGKEREENPDMGKPKAGGLWGQVLAGQERALQALRTLTLTTKCKVSETAAVPHKVPHMAEEHILTVEPTMADDADNSGKSEVEVQEALKKVHPVPRLVKPLPVRTAAGPSRIRADDLDNERLHADNECLWEEVEKLRGLQDNYDRFMRNLNYQAHKQQQELITMRNRLYSFSDEWRVMGQEMDDFVVGQEQAWK